MKQRIPDLSDKVNDLIDASKRGERNAPSPAELRVLLLALEGLSTNQIAGKLIVAPQTVRNQLFAVYRMCPWAKDAVHRCRQLRREK